MDFRLLGPVEVSQGGRVVAPGGHQQRALLALLVLRANQVVSTDRLIDLMWGDAPPNTARKSLQAYVSRLKTALDEDPPRISPVPPGYVLRADPDEIDAIRFEHLAAQGKSLMEDDPEKAATIFREALELWRGECLGDVADVPGIQPDAVRLEELQAQVLEDRITSELAAGWGDDLVGELEGLVAVHPLRERLWGLLMVTLYQSGRQAEALRVYQEARRTLGEEVGIEPSEELTRLEERILLQDPDLLPPDETQPRPHVPGPVRNPYKGLRPFGPEDSRDFFGRTALVAEIVERLATGERFQTLVGPSGCGKSSVVKAGLLPTLRAGALDGSDKWIVAEMTPGSHPFVELEAAFLRAGGGQPQEPTGTLETDELSALRAALRILPAEDGCVLLVIDQLEELFAPGVSEERRWAFVRAIIIAVTDPHCRIRVIATLRGDFYDRALAIPEFAELVTAGLIAVPPLRGSEVEEAVVNPAAAVGLEVEPELLAEVATDVAAQPGSLPLFQYALTEVFEHRADTSLTLDAYRAIGGIRGALTRRADYVYERFDTDGRETVRQLFLRLVTPGEGTLDVRRRVPLAELTGLGAGEVTMQEAMDKFGRYRLLTFDREPVSGVATVEVAHEALLREWTRLREWIDASRNDLRHHRSIAERTAEWLQTGRHPDYLPTGLRLQQSLDWREATSLHLSANEHAFLNAGERRRDEELAEAKRRHVHEMDLERRSVRRLWTAIGVLAVAAVVAAVLGAIALTQRGEARDQAATAELQATRAEAAAAAEMRARNLGIAKELTLVSFAYTDVDPQVSLHLILHAVNVLDTLDEEVPVDTVAGLHWALQATDFRYPQTDSATAVLVGPHGRTGVYDMDLDDLVQEARRTIERDLTAEECEFFFSQGTCPSLPNDLGSGLAAAALPMAPDSALPLAGTSVTIWGGLDGYSADRLRDALAFLSDETGIAIHVVEVADLENDLQSAIAAGTLPDFVMIAQPAVVEQWARDGVLIDLAASLDTSDLEARMSPYLLGLGTIDGQWPPTDGHLYGLVINVSVKGLVWYPVPEFEDAGYAIPTTWDEMMALSDEMVADGQTPWCMGEESDHASGWPGTDWIEDIVLHDGGPELYDRWISHEIAFDDPLIRRAFERYGNIAFTDGYVAGGARAVASTHFSVAINPLAFDPPGCWLHHQASFAAGWLFQEAEVGTDVWAFPFPPISERGEDALLGAADLLAAFSDRPEVRVILDRFASPDVLPQFTSINRGFLVPHRGQDREFYPDEFRRWQADLLDTALANDAFRFDGSDLMPPSVGICAFWEGILDYLEEGSDGLDAILAQIDKSWETGECGDPPA